MILGDEWTGWDWAGDLIFGLVQGEFKLDFLGAEDWEFIKDLE